MLTNAQIKLINSLHSKKGRRETGLFIAEGDKLCIEFLQSNIKVINVYAVKDWIDSNNKYLQDLSSVIKISEKELSRLSNQKTPNQVLIVAEAPKTELTELNFTNNITLVLENIQDPGNLGNIIRTADWFGVENIICSPDCVELSNPKVVQASMGSILRTKVVYHHLDDFFQRIPGKLPVFGAFLDGISIKKVNFPETFILVIGNESKGISEKTSRFVTQKTTIPSFPFDTKSPQAESLNVSVATAIYLAWSRIY